MLKVEATGGTQLTVTVPRNGIQSEITTPELVVATAAR